MTYRYDDGKDPDVGDAATGLPPIDVIDPTGSDLLLAMVWSVSEGIVRLPNSGTDVAVHWLHLRGLSPHPDDPARTDWTQVHIAIPAEHAMDVAADLTAGKLL